MPWREAPEVATARKSTSHKWMGGVRGVCGVRSRRTASGASRHLCVCVRVCVCVCVCVFVYVCGCVCVCT